MLTKTKELLDGAREGGYAVGAFNVYNLEGVRAVISAAENARSPVILQLLPFVLRYGGLPLVALCKEAARTATVPVSVQLDHGTDGDDILAAVHAELPSVMADGSALPYEENLHFTRNMALVAHWRGATVEAQLGTTERRKSGPPSLTDPDEAFSFVEATCIDALAVCIGNLHGSAAAVPYLDFDRLEQVRRRVNIPLVLHGSSGLTADDVEQAISLGITKFNVNAELRQAYMDAPQQLFGETTPDLVEFMNTAVHAMQEVVTAKIHLFGSSGRAEPAY